MERSPYAGHDVCRAARKHVEPSPHWPQECIMFGYTPPKEEVPKMTESLDQFRTRYDADDNVWWTTDSGDQQNLFEEALARIDDLSYRLRAFKFMLDREAMKNIRANNVVNKHMYKSGKIDQDATVPVMELLEASRGEYVDPPEGWVDFGTHAAYDVVPPLEFSLELDHDGLPMWERPVQP